MLLFFPMMVFIACGSTRVAPSAPQKTDAPAETISLLFAGDIMAHTVNYNFGHFDAIWSDVQPVIAAADLAFANVEAPVSDKLPWSSYPQFNMHGSYIDAAIVAGFDVFSLANNHTNDQSLNGMRGTLAYFAGKKNVWACGIKEKANAPLTYRVVKKNGWTILFVAFTEILNSQDSAGYIDYIPSKGKKHDAIVADLRALREAHPCDIFVVSVHADEPEYVRTVHDYQKTFYHQLILDAGADVVWSNHAHVVKPWEVVPQTETARGGLIMYANGNTISGQRTKPSYSAPDTSRDWTGDGLLMGVTFTKTTAADGNAVVSLGTLTPHFITTYITPAWQFVVRLLDDDLSHSLRRAGLTTWATYLSERKKLMKKIEEQSTWQ